MARKRGVVILAAGAGTRLGGVAKALLRTKSGLTFLEQIATTARQVGLDSAIVVAGPPYGIEVANHARDLRLDVMVNPKPERGMASSVALGFTAMTDTSCDEAWLWPVDHPDVSEHTLSALIAGLGSHDAVRPVVGARGGHPPLVARSLWARLAGCAYLPNGARDAFAGADIADVLVSDSGCVRDVDTALDLEVVR
jgi:CTP:molybdopterin cytidylyltransferase MocA